MIVATKLVKTVINGIDEQLESLILLSCVKNIELNIEEAVNRFYSFLDLLKSHPIYKYKINKF